MKIAILGYDTEGRASYEYFKAHGHQLTICDQNSDLRVPAGAQTVLGSTYLNDLDSYDLLVRTPGLPPAKILKASPGVEAKITSQLNEFLKVCPTKNVIGVTGTKGKGTTCTLIAKMLEAIGKTVVLGGNIGVAPLSFIDKLTADSWVVLELSSFQLIDLQASPHLAVCLMVAPEHLDWHTDTDEYFSAKTQLFRFQTKDDIAVYFADSEPSKKIAGTGHAQTIPYFAEPGAVIKDGAINIDGQVICSTSDLKLLGEHNWQNVCAAVTTVWHAGADTQDVAAIRGVLTSFSGLEHRLEMVRELAGVKYYDDSFGTTPETAIVALQAIKQPKIMILGGSDKGADYAALAQAVKDSNVRRVILIGQQAGRIQAALTAVGFGDSLVGDASMKEIVTLAHDQAQSGEAVLLSPACASFDMFKNYQDRGEQFKTAVQELAATA